MTRLMRGLGIFALLAALLSGVHPAAAADGTVIATGLQNPRGVAVGEDGTVYVAEAGTGGDQSVTVGDATVKVGNTSQITAIAPDGRRRVVAGGFFSTATAEGEVVGLHGLIYGNGALWAVTAGALQVPQPPPGSGALVRVDPQSGAMTQVADIQAYEKANNPGGFAVDSNPYGLALGPDGQIYVADAGANAILRVDPATGKVDLAALIEGLALPPGMAPPGGNPARGGANELDPVPTDITFDPKGTAYISLLSGGPFPTGAARIVSIDASGEFGVAAEGLTMLTDVEVGPDGNWYAVQFAEFDLTSTPPGFTPNSGKVWRIRASGQRDVVADGLMFPNKLAFDRSGNLYVTANSIIPNAGQVLRYAGVGRGGVVPGMPTTGTPADLGGLLALGALLLLAGVGLRRRSGGRVVA